MLILILWLFWSVVEIIVGKLVGTYFMYVRHFDKFLFPNVKFVKILTFEVVFRSFFGSKTKKRGAKKYFKKIYFGAHNSENVPTYLQDT